MTATPLKSVAELGAVGRLAGRAITLAFRRPLSYGHELVAQINFALRVASLPMVLTSFALAFGPAGVQAGGFLKLFGSLDRLGATFAVIVVREFAPFVCAIIVAGVAGTAMCADLGARRIRDEVDALSVLGVDAVQSLVVPRLIALMVVTTLFDVYAILFGVLAGIVVTLMNGAQLGPFFETLFQNANAVEFTFALAKTALYGAVIAIVCCHKGLGASGGAEGVGRAVNQAVVISFLGIGVVNYVFTSVLLATHPALSLPR